MKEILNGSFPGIPDPDCLFAVVDVRDAAEAHYQALFSPNSVGKKYVNAGHNASLEDICTILRETFESEGYKIPSQKLTIDQIKQSGN